MGCRMAVEDGSPAGDKVEIAWVGIWGDEKARGERAGGESEETNGARGRRGVRHGA